MKDELKVRLVPADTISTFVFDSLKLLNRGYKHSSYMVTFEVCFA